MRRTAMTVVVAAGVLVGGCGSMQSTQADRPVRVVRHDQQEFFGAGDAAGYALFRDGKSGEFSPMMAAARAPKPSRATVSAN